MDIGKTKFKYCCLKHPDFKVEFLQVKNLLETSNKQNHLFYCSACVIEDSSFKKDNVQLIQQIIKTGTTQILKNWPPINDHQLIDQLIEGQKREEQNQTIETQIINYFTELKNEIYSKIDACQKNMIKLAEEITLKKNNILSRYTELSRINELRTYLLNSKTDIHEKERQCRELIEKISSEQIQITESLQVIVDQQKQSIIFNAASPQQIKQSILKSIDSINFFDFPNDQQSSSQFDIEIVSTNYNDSKQLLNISKKNQLEVFTKQRKANFVNCVSRILENDKKYIFRIEIQNIDNVGSFMIGLMKDLSVDKSDGSTDHLYSQFGLRNEQIAKINGNTKIIKGDKFVLSKEQVIEMRVCIQDQVFELFDYPNYLCKLTVSDDKKSNLINHLNLRLFFALYNTNLKIILRDAFIVNQFE